MDGKKGWFFEDDNSDMLDSVRRFEEMISRRAHYFFDVHELEDVIDYYLDMGDFRHATKAARYAMNTYPGSASIQQRVCEILIDKGRPAEALQILEKLSAFSDCDYEVFLLKGEALLQVDRSKEAIRAFEKGYAMAGEEKDAVSHRIGILLERSGLYHQSLRYLEEARKLNPEDYMVFYDLAYCWDKLDNCKKSVLYYQKFLDEDPFSEHVWYNLGIAYGRLEEYNKALEAYDYAIAINDQYASAYFNKANVLAEKGLYEESIVIYKDFIELEPDSTAAYCYIGESYEKLGDEETALEYYRFALSLDPSFFAAWLGAGLLYCRKGSMGEGLSSLQKALEINPVAPEALLGMARAQRVLSDVPAAERMYEQLLLVDRDNPEIPMEFAEFLYASKPCRALEVLEQACLLFPEERMLHLKLGAYLCMNGRKEQGKPILERGWSGASAEERKQFSLNFSFLWEDPSINPALKDNDLSV